MTSDQSNNNMVRFSWKLSGLVVASVVVASYLSWTAITFVSNPQAPLRINMEAEKRDTHNISNDSKKYGAANDTEKLRAKKNMLHPKIVLKDKKQQETNKLSQTEGSQENSNQRINNKGNEAPQLIEKSGINDKLEGDVANADLQGNDAVHEEAAEDHERMQTFFSSLPISFSASMLQDGNGIPTKSFIDACHTLTPFLDKIGRTLSLARRDLTVNTEKINAAYLQDPDNYQTLQSMVLHELDNGDFKVNDKGTISLMWLIRGFEFVAEFLQRVADGEEPSQAASSAYDHTLSKHHNFFIRGTFKLALKTLSYRTEFLKTLALNQEDTASRNFTDIVVEDIINYNKGLKQYLQILRDFYTEHGIGI